MLKLSGLLWFLGIVLSSILFSLHLGKGSGLCNINATFNCSAVMVSKYSYWFGIPVPIWMLTFFVLGTLVLAFGLKSKTLEKHLGILYGLSLVGVIPSIIFLIISIFVIQKICIYCAFTYVLSGALVWAHHRLLKIKNQPYGYLIQQSLKTFYRSRAFWISTLVPAAIFGLSVWAYTSTLGLSEKKYEIVGEQNRTMGDVAAPVVLTVFSDFQCPACKHVSGILKQLVDSRRARVKMVYKFFPLDPRCNSMVPAGAGHAHACTSAVAATCASAQFWEFHDELFKNQEWLSDETILKIAQGLGVQQFELCFKSEKALAVVKKDIAEGQKLSLQGTPSIFINGREYQGQLKLEDLQAVVDRE